MIDQCGIYFFGRVTNSEREETVDVDTLLRKEFFICYFRSKYREIKYE